MNNSAYTGGSQRRAQSILSGHKLQKVKTELV